MLKATHYQTSIPFHGDADEAMKLAKTTLLSLGFEISNSTATELRVRGPGMHSSQQPALLGVTSLTLKINGYAITADAKLGGAAAMRTFIFVFPPALMLFLLLVFELMKMDVSWVHGAWILPWFVIAPWMGSMIERKSTRAVNSLVNGMAQCK